MTKDLREKNVYDRGKLVKIYFNGKKILAYEGENLASALHASNKKILRFSPNLNMPRGVFCLIGSCQECLLLVNGKRKLACLTYIKENMLIKSIEFYAKK